MIWRFDALRFGITCKVKRQMLNLNTREMAELSGLSQPTVSRYERAERIGDLELETILRICTALDIDPRQFFTQTREKTAGDYEE